MIRQIILDTETTGLYCDQGDRLTEIGCLELIDRRLTGKVFHTYINPERELSPKSIEITGLTKSFLKDKPTFSQVVDDFLRFVIGSEIIIHNSKFDIGFINCELNRIKHPMKKINNFITIYDTLKIARKLFPGQRNNLDA